MNNNILYNICEINDLPSKNLNDIEVPKDELNQDKNLNYNEEIYYNDYNIEANRLNYELNYNIKQLNFLSNFYNLKPEKKKSNIINNIINFESNLNNINKTIEFHNLMEKFIELKANYYFSKFIISPF